MLGVTAGEVNISEIPAVIPIAVWISARPESKGTFSISIRVLNVDKKEIVKGDVVGEVTSLTRTVLAFGPVPVSVEKPGDYDFEWSFGENAWEKIGTYRVNFVPT